ncbi:MAG: type II secretion system F family protein [Mycobacteriales bacterium]
MILYVGLLCIFLSTGLLVVMAGTSAGQRQQVSRSMGALQSAGPIVAVGEPQPSFIDRVLHPALGRLSGIARKFSPGGVAGTLQHRLDLAGNPDKWDPDRVLAFKTLGLLGLGALGLLLGSSKGVAAALLFAAMGAAAGFFLPDLLLYNTGTKRQQQIQKALPDALDLLTISVEAGLGFDAALAQVARNTAGPLAGDFFRVLQEMQIGKSRTESLRGLSARTNVQELRGFITAMVQADKFGIPIANVLRVQAGEMRLKRQQRAEEKAQKVPVKVLFPLVMTILPCLFVIIIGPGALQIIKAFSKL